MLTGTKGKQLIQYWEKCKLAAYKDAVGIWTIAWGLTHYPDGSAVKEGDTCTQEQADAWFVNSLKDFEIAVNNACRRLNQNQFDACVSLVYNIGPGNFMHSPVRAIIVQNPLNPSITTAFMAHVYARATQDAKDESYKKGDLIKLQGLVNRRTKEAELYTSLQP